MSRKLTGQVAFNAGELAPEMYARIDLEQYNAGLETCTNAFLKPLGPVRRRNGFKYIAEVKDSSKAVRIFKFQTSTATTFVLEFGEGYIRFYASQGQVTESTQAITGITQANPGVVTITSHGYSDGDQVILQSIVGMTELNEKRFTVANKTANTFELSGEDTTAYTAYSSGGTAKRIYTVTAPYQEDELDDIQLTQIGDSVYIAHPLYAPRVLNTTATTSWTLETLDLESPPTIELGHTDLNTLTPGATTGTGVTFTGGSTIFLDGDIGREIVNLSGTGKATITALGAASPSATVTCDITEDFPSTSAIAAANWKLELSPVADITPDGTTLRSIITIDADTPGTNTASDSFRTGDVGKYISLNGGIARITQRVSGSQIKAQVVKTLTGITETSNWTLEEDTWSSSRGYPKCVTFFQERLVFAGTTTQPQTLWFSEIDEFGKFGVGTNDADAIQIKLGGSQPTNINWLAVTRNLLIGTSNAIGYLRDGLITPSNIPEVRFTYLGSNIQKIPIIGNDIIFTDANERRIYNYGFKFEIDGFEEKDITFLASHITENKVKELVYAQSPDSIIYARDNAGDILAATYFPLQGVLGWAKWTLNGTCESMATISNNNKDELWIVHNQTINGTTKRYIELLDSGTGEEVLDGFHDSYKTYSEPVTVSAITKANPAVVTATAHGFSDGDEVKFKEMVGMTEINNRTYVVANKTTNTFELTGTDSTSYGTFTSGEVHKLVSTISNLDYLEGETVSVKVDGSNHPDRTVSSGAITLQDGYAEVTVGIDYTTTIKTLAANYDVNQGTQVGQRTRRPSPILKVFKSAIPTLNGNFLPSRKPSYNMDAAVPLYTGNLEYGPVTWDTAGSLTVTTSEIFPFQLNGIFGTIEGGAP